MMLSRRSKLTANALISLLVLVGFPAFAQKPPSCSEQAKTKLEETYCQIKEKSPSTRLPSFHEFKKNPPKTQRLLLRRPAKKLGLTLPEVSSTPNKGKNRKPRSDKLQNRKQTTPKRARASTQGLADYCTMAKATITCDDMHFALLNNMPNHKLAKDALNESNVIRLPPFDGDKSMQTQVISYLDEAYTQYIAHMIKIGLAASTMSFTKFYHTFMEVESNKVSFSERLSQMFVYLKKDKTNIGVKSRYNNHLPKNLDNCESRTKNIIVCDNVRQNWVYQQTQ